MRRAAVAIALLVAGCTTPAQRIAARLGEYGVPPAQARCMGDRLQSRLSIAQLRRLDEIGRIDGDRVGRMTIKDIGRQLTDPRDPALAIEFVRAGLGCAL